MNVSAWYIYIYIYIFFFLQKKKEDYFNNLIENLATNSNLKKKKILSIKLQIK